MPAARVALRLVEAYSTPIALALLLGTCVLCTWASGNGVLAQTVTDALIRVDRRDFRPQMRCIACKNWPEDLR